MAQTTPAVRALLAQGIRTLQQRRYHKALDWLQRAHDGAPADAAVNLWLAIGLLLAGRNQHAALYLLTAAELHPIESPAYRLCRHLLRLLGDRTLDRRLPSNPAGKIQFRSLHDHAHHRSGWRYALDSLLPLHNDGAILFESFLEKPFFWQRQTAAAAVDLMWQLAGQIEGASPPDRQELDVPFRRDWVGFVHNPPHMPDWFFGEQSLSNLLASDAWQQSMPTCRGLFTLSDYLAGWLRQRVAVPVSSLIYPTEQPAITFDWMRFCDNPAKRIVQVGWWLRRLNAIFDLPAPQPFTKLYLQSHADPLKHDRVERLRVFEREQAPAAASPVGETEIGSYLDNDGYDRLLAENVVFLNLYDVGANTTVVECIARATPLLVNRLPAVVDYLGADYPLYYDTLADAGQLAADRGRLLAAHQQLRESPIAAQLSGDDFRDAFVASEVYQALP